MKKTLCIVLSLSMLFCTLLSAPFGAFAYDYNGFECENKSDSTVVIKGYSGEDIDVYIPTQINGKNVSEIADFAFFQNNSITEYHIPSTITTIGTAAFFECSAEKIHLTDSIETIGENAFMNCTLLRSIYIGKNITAFNNDMISGCSRLTEITVSDENENYSSEDGVLFNKEKTQLLRYPQGLEAEAYTVPDGVEDICEGAFFGCQFKEITLPESLKSVKDKAFDSAASLKNVNYLSTEKNWQNVTVSDVSNSYFINAEKHFQTEPEPCETHTKGDEETVIVPPTCTEGGISEYVCTVCGEAFKEETAPLGHTPETLAAVPATYFESGKTKGEKCSVCGEILTPQKEVAKLVLAPVKKKKLTAKKKSFVFNWTKNTNATGYIVQYSLKKNFSKKKTVKIKKNSTLKKTVKKLKSKKKYYVRIRAYRKEGNKTVYSNWSKTYKIKVK